MRAEQIDVKLEVPCLSIHMCHPDKHAWRAMVDLLALAHDRACEAELAAILDADLAAGKKKPEPQRVSVVTRGKRGSRRDTHSKDDMPTLAEHFADRARGM